MEKLLTYTEGAMEPSELVFLVSSLCNAKLLLLSLEDLDSEEPILGLEIQDVHGGNSRHIIPLVGTYCDADDGVGSGVLHPSKMTRAFLHNNFLQFLRESVNQVTDLTLIGTDGIAGLTNDLLQIFTSSPSGLKSLHLVETKVVALGSKGIEGHKMRGIQHLKLNSCCFGGRNGAAIAESTFGDWLSEVQTLRSCVFVELHFTQIGFRAILRGLRDNAALQRLNVHCYLGSATAQELELLAGVVLESRDLQVLDISASGLEGGIKGHQFLSSVLAKKGLELVLGNGLNPDDNAAVIGEGFSKHRATKLLSWTYRRFNDCGAVSTFSKGIADNSSLTSLDLTGCSFSSNNELEILINGLTKCETLQELKIGIEPDELPTYLSLDSACALLLDGLVESRIKTLIFGPLEMFGYMGRAALGRLVSASHTLKELILDVELFDEECAKYLADALVQSQRLESLAVRRSEGIYGSGEDEMARCVQDTMSLMDVKLPPFDDVDQEELLELYLKLNRLGRRKVLDPNFPTQLLAPLFARIGTDLDCMYYFVREKVVQI